MLLTAGHDAQHGEMGERVRKLVLLVLLVAAWFAYANRFRLFVRDPLAAVSRDGVKEAGAQVFLNYNSDVLLENDHAPMYFNIVQHGQPVGAPDALKCIHYLVCLASGYPAPQISVLPGAKLEAMSTRQVRFQDSQGRAVVIDLR